MGTLSAIQPKPLPRRAKFIEKLEEQKRLLTDPGYVRTVQRDCRSRRREASSRSKASGLAVVEDLSVVTFRKFEDPLPYAMRNSNF